LSWLKFISTQHDLSLQTVTSLDFTSRTVSISSRVIPYDTLVIATGASPRRLPIPNVNLSNVHVLREIGDAEAINDSLGDTNGKNVTIIGSSFIGMELAVAISSKGGKVRVVGMEKVPFQRVSGSSRSDLGKLKVRLGLGREGWRCYSKGGILFCYLYWSGSSFPVSGSFTNPKGSSFSWNLALKFSMLASSYSTRSLNI
jgi:hypothetical protein